MMLIIHYRLNVDVWSTPLMILGTQWYILFNVISGVQALSPDLKLVAKNYGLRGWVWWKRLILPSIFPYYVTGAITAAGGCWNASILADVIRWGDTTITATGLGGYINAVTRSGDFPRIALGIGVMCILVTIINRLVWHRLYTIINFRYQIGQGHE
jgi:NitT/TauT family transport system permease protein